MRTVTVRKRADNPRPLPSSRPAAALPLAWMCFCVAMAGCGDNAVVRQTDADAKVEADSAVDSAPVPSPCPPGPWVTFDLDVAGVTRRLCVEDFASWGAQPATPALAVAGDGVVSDTLTGRTWQASPSSQAMDLAKAREHCDKLVLAGATDWRLPTVAELQSLVDFDRFAMALPGPLEMAGLATTTWAVGPRPTQPWVVEFRHGQTALAALGSVHRARCVRSDPKPVILADRWVAQSQQVALDLRLGLQWLRFEPVNTYLFVHAFGWCAQVNAEGKGWRTPSVRELQSIVDRSVGPPHVDSSVFLQPRGSYWASTGVASSQGGIAWAVGIDDGATSAFDVSTFAGVRCVRAAVGKP